MKISKDLRQNKKGLYQIKEKNNETEYSLIGRINIKQITITKDELGLFEPVFSMLYTDLVYNEEKEICDVTFKELIQKLDQEKLFKKNKQSIEATINKIIIDSVNEEIGGTEFIKKDKRVFKEGFFIKDGKVIENTAITGLKPTKEQIKESITLVNEIISNRGFAKANDCTVLRFMLWSPFAWCLKEIGKSKKMYGVILTGKRQTNKTGSCENFSWLYSNPTDRNHAVNTTSVFGSRLEESTLPAIIDEAYDLLSKEDMQDPMKNCIYNKQTRSTKDKNNPQEIINYLALGLPIFTMNEYIQFKGHIMRRYHISRYTEDMVVDDDTAVKFEIKYCPQSEDSPLKVLRYLGRAFADKFIPYIENRSNELFQLEKLTIAILKEIAAEVGEEFNEEVYNIQDSVDSFAVDKCSTIRSGLNNLFRKSCGYYSIEYTVNDFISCSNNGAINWLYYRKSDEEFVINKKGFEHEVSQIAGENLDYKSIIKELNIDIKNITVPDKPIHTNRGNTRGFKIKPKDLIEKIFDVKYTIEE